MTVRPRYSKDLGLLNRLVQSLSEGTTEAHRWSYLILDEFMNSEVNRTDLDLLIRPKASIREKAITVIVLKSNYSAGFFFLSQNNLVAIVPMATLPDIEQLQIYFGGTKIQPNTIVPFRWEEHVSMVWEKDEMKKSPYGQP